MEKTNPKALNLEAVRIAESNVTVGFKCEPELKLLLAEEAENAGLTLSNYVSKLVGFEINVIRQLRQENQSLKGSIEKSNNLLTFYRNQLLFDLYDLHKGKQISYLNRFGEMVKQKITSIEDVYLVIINSFKYQL